MYILGFSIQIWLITVAAIAALVLSKRRKSKPLVAIGTVLAIVAVAAIGLQVSVWLSPPLAEVEDSRVPTSQEERHDEGSSNRSHSNLVCRWRGHAPIFPRRIGFEPF